MILVTGRVRARPETLDQVLELSVEHVRRSRQEPGCVLHTVQRDVEDPLRLFFFEEWTDQEALDAHFAVPASLDFVSALGALVAEPAVMHVYEAQRLRL